MRLSDSTLLRYLASQTSAYAGREAYMVILPLVILGLATDEAVFSKIFALISLPQALIVAFGMKVLERYDPRFFVMMSGLIRAVAIAVLAFLIVAGTHTLPVIIGIAIVIAAADAIFYPTSLSLLPRLVNPNDRRSANAWHQGSVQVVRSATPAIAGMVAAKFGIGIGLVLAGSLYFISFLSAKSLPLMPTVENDKAINVTQSTLQFFRKYPHVRSLMIIAASINLFFAGPNLIGTVLFSSVNPNSIAVVGLMFTCFGIGAFAGTILAARGPEMRQELLFTVLPFVVGTAAMALAMTQSVILGGIIRIILGAFIAYANVALITGIQNGVDDTHLKRGMALLAICGMGLQPISMMGASLFAPAGFEAVFAGSAACLLMTSFAFWLLKLRRTKT